MKVTIQKRTISSLTLLLIALSSCSGLGGDDPGVDFDRVAMNENYATNAIIPSYQALQNAIGELKNAADVFSETPDTDNLATLQNRLKTARMAWQDANVFQFGPAEMATLRTSLNTYPADTGQINSNIESGSYTLGTLENRAAAGLPTLGYLLHGIGSTRQEIVDKYTSDANASNRMTYLLDNIAFIKGKTDDTLNEWSAGGGNYLATFTNEQNSGADVGSSLSMMINALILHYERFIRDGKIGIPAGVRSSGVTRPSATEAYYAGYSAELAVANMQAIKRLVKGTALDGRDGIGLEEHLEALGAGDLATEILSQVDVSVDALKALSDPLSEQIETDNEPVLKAFEEMQKAITLLKADMTSVLGVTITFQDNDGD